MDNEVFLTADLARAARAFTKVSTKTLAQDAGLTKEQVRSFERSLVALTDAEKARLVASLEKYGALFIAEDATAGYGVRRKYNRQKLRQLNTWESEGGQP